MSDAGPTPTLLAILICDLTIRDQITQKHTLVGLFNRVSAKTFPCLHPCMHVFVSLTNGHGNAAGELRLVRRETDEVLTRIGGTIHFPDPLAVVEMDFAIFNTAFPRPGRYCFDFYCNGELIGSRPFDVVPIREAPPEKT